MKLLESTVSPLKRERLQYADMAKGIALILVIFSHTSGWNYVLFSDDMNVPLFYVAAGFTSSTAFSLRKKFRSLLIPYITMSVICLSISIFYFKQEFTPLSIAGIFYSRHQIFTSDCNGDILPLMTLHNAVLWFLTSLFTSYCIYKVILMPRSRYGQLTAAIASLALAWVLSYLPILLPWSLDTAFFFAPLMWIAGLLRKSRVIETHTMYTLIASISIYILAIQISPVCNLSIRDYGNSMIFLFIAALAGSMALLAVCRYFDNTIISKFFTKLNTQALYIFGLQLVFLNYMEIRLCPLHLTGWRFILIQTACAAMLGYLTGIIASISTTRIRLLFRRILCCGKRQSSNH